MDPQALSPVHHQSDLSKVREMARDVRLCRSDGVGQLADAELLVPQKEHQTAQPGGVGQGGKQTVGRHVHAGEDTAYCIYEQVNIL